MTLATRVLESPGSTVGTPTGDGDWRVVVEVLLPADPTSVVGVAVVGTDVVSEDVWTDMRDYLTGFSVTPGGSDFGQHPRPSVATITLLSEDHRFAPWAPYGQAGSGSRFKSGCPVRVVLFDPVAVVWYPLFTGEIETAAEKTMQDVGILEINAIDPVSARLTKAQLLEYVVDSDATGQTITATIDELLTYADWPYGSLIDSPIDDSNNEYKIAGSTLVSGNVAEQLRRLADACGRQFSADPFGRAAFVRRRPQIYTYTNTYMTSTDANAPATISLNTGSDSVFVDTISPYVADDAIINSVEMLDLWGTAGIGGPATVDSDASAARATAFANSDPRYGLRSASTGTLITSAEGLWSWYDITAEVPTNSSSVRRYGRRKVSMSGVFPTYYGDFVGQKIADEIIDQYDDDLWVLPDVGLDNREIGTIAAAEIGAASTIVHDGATFTGHLGAMTVTSTPQDDACRIEARMTFHCYALTRAALP